MPSKKSVVVAVVVAYFAYRFYASRNGTPEPPRQYAPVVDTANGPVRGLVSTSRDGRPYHEYRGIPYGSVTERFGDSELYAGKWGKDGSPRDATEFGSECIQMGMLIGNIGGEEDCLFLNVFVPKAALEKKSLLPVLVFIHGGHFTEGASEKHLPDYFMDEDLIVVTPNYRLGVFGFLNTGDGVVRGNMGLKDQSLALRWIAANIKTFGGDPNRVTLSGESAGSACVHYHVMSPMSRGLFQRAISMSGTALAQWARMPNPKEQAVRLGKRAKCPTQDTKEMVRCLRKLPSQNLIELEGDMLDYPRKPVTLYVPTIETVRDERTFLGEKPEELLRRGDFNKVPFLTGVNSDEGLIASAQITAISGALDKMEHDTVSALSATFYFPSSTPEAVIHKIRTQYFGEGVAINTRDVFENYTRLGSDRHFFVSLEEAVRLQAAASDTSAPVYVYYNSYATEFSLANILLAITHRFPPLLELLAHVASSWIKKSLFGLQPEHHGVCHADELALFFHMPGLTHVDRQHRDYAVSKRAVRLWADFVRGKELKFDGVKWEPVKVKDAKADADFKYLHIDSKSRGMITPPFRERLKFWHSLKLDE